MEQYNDTDDIDVLMGVAPDALDEHPLGEPDSENTTADGEQQGRKEKVSTLPHDYDPTPDYHTVPKGHARPPQVCHADSNVVQEYDLGLEVPLLSAGALAGMGTRERKFRFLATKCVSVSGAFFVKERVSGIWRPHTKKDAEAQLLNDWMDSTRYNIQRTTVRDFFMDARYPVVHQTVYVPGASDFVQFEGKRCLNLGQEPPRSFDPRRAGSDDFELLMMVINQNLLGLPPAPVDEIVYEISSAESSVLKWVFHWWASVYQRPGLHIGTNLWFVGSQQGVGKGLLSDALIWLVGPGNGRKVHAKELSGEWNDFIEGNVLLIGDEITMASKKGFNDMLKSFVANDVIALRKRNVGQYNIPNVTNWMFTTNNPKPITIDEDDRRNTFVATREDFEARTLARQFGELSSAGKLRAYQGVAALLNDIAIDDRLIRHAIDTPLKEQLKELGAKPVRLWFRESAFITEQWAVGDFCSSDQLFQDFSTWASDGGFHPSVTSRQAFSIEMAELAKKGVVSKKGRKMMRDGRKPYGYLKLKEMAPHSCPEFEPDEAETEGDDGGELRLPSSKKTSALVFSLRERLAARNR